jgi:rhamnogalacturonyl hydrolase YesR
LKLDPSRSTRGSIDNNAARALSKGFSIEEQSIKDPRDLNWYHDWWSSDDAAVSSPKGGSLRYDSSAIPDDHATISSMDDNAARDLSMGFSIEEQSIKDPRDFNWYHYWWSSHLRRQTSEAELNFYFL